MKPVIVLVSEGLVTTTLAPPHVEVIVIDFDHLADPLTEANELVDARKRIATAYGETAEGVSVLDKLLRARG